MKTRDEATENLHRFVNGIGVPQILVSHGAAEYIGQNFRRLCRKQQLRLSFHFIYPSRKEKDRTGVANDYSKARCKSFDSKLSTKKLTLCS